MVKNKKTQPISKTGFGGFMRKVLAGNVEVRDLLFFGIGLLLTATLLFFAYFILFNFRVAFNPILPTINELLDGMGVTSIWDKIVFFNYGEWLSITSLFMGIIPSELIAVGLLQIIVVWVLIGFFVCLASFGHTYRITLNVVLVVIAFQLMIIWFNPSLAGGFGEIQSSASIMLLVNGAGVFGFALLFNITVGRLLFKYARQWENIGNKRWSGETEEIKRKTK